MFNHRRHFYDFGRYRLIENERVLLRDGSPVPLTPKAFDTLEVLVRNSLRIVSREDLICAVWPDSVVEDNNLAQQISFLRRSFADSEPGQEYIATVPKRGYRFAVPVNESWETLASAPDSESGSMPDSTTQPKSAQPDEISSPGADSVTPTIWRQVRWAASGAALLAVGLVALLLIGRSQRTWAAHPVLQPRRSLAILNFRNITGDARVDWLSSGLAEMFRTELAAGRAFRIIPAENIARMQRELELPGADSLSPETLARIRKNIGVDVVLSGSYTASGSGPSDQFRIDVRTQDSVTGEITSSETRTVSNSGLLDAISQSAVVLRRSLSITEPASPELRSSRESFPQDPEGQRLYAEGVAKLRLLDASGAVPLLERAAARDARSPLIRSALAEALSMLGYKRRATEEAQKAFELAKDFPSEQSIEIEGPYRELAHQWDRALDIYKSLWTVFSDNTEYGLRLANDQIESGKSKDALATIAGLRKATSPVEDPRIYLTEAAAAEAMGDFKREYDVGAQAAAAANIAGARLLRANALLRECWALNSTGNRKQALALASQAKDLFSAAGDPGGEARAVKNIADVLDDGEQHAEGLKKYETALEMFRTIGNETGVAITLNNMAHAMRNEGDLAGARKRFQEALALSRRVGDDARVALALNGLGILMWRQEGNLAGAQKMYEQAVTIHLQQNDHARAATVLGNLAIILQDQGHLGEARKRFEESLTMQRDLDDRPGMARTYGNLGELLLDIGDLSGAKKAFLEHLRVANEMSDAKQRGYALFGIGEVLMLEGDLNGALAKHIEALKLRIDNNEQGLAAESRMAIGATLIELGHRGEAAAELKNSIDEFQREKELDQEVQAKLLVAESFLPDGSHTAAREILDSVFPRIANVEDISARISMTIKAGTIRGRLGDRASAESILKSAQTEAIKAGYRLHELEAELSLADLDGNSGSRAARLLVIQQEANRARFGLIARKATTLLRP